MTDRRFLTARPAVVEKLTNMLVSGVSKESAKKMVPDWRPSELRTASIKAKRLTGQPMKKPGPSAKGNHFRMTLERNGAKVQYEGSLKQLKQELERMEILFQ